MKKQYFITLLLAGAIALSAAAPVGNYGDITILDTFGNVRFRHNFDGVLRSYNASGTVTSEWDSGDGSFAGAISGGVAAEDVFPGTLQTGVVVQDASLSSNILKKNAGGTHTISAAISVPSLSATGAVSGDRVIVGDPSGDGLSFGVAGTVNGQWGLFQQDVHALDTVYGSMGVVVGFGRQNHTHDGSLWLATAGTDGVPTPGSQEARVYTDTSGTHFENHHAAAEQGGVDTAFHFDDVLKPQGYAASDGSEGITATVPAGSSLTVKNGIIVGFTEP